MQTTVADWSERIALGSRDSELAAKIQARFTLKVSPIGAARSKFCDCVIIADCRIRKHTRLE